MFWGFGVGPITVLSINCLILSELGGWGQVNIKDHHSPAEVEVGAELGNAI